MAVKKEKFWGSNHYGHPPLTDEMISIAEKNLNIKLPSLLIELLSIQNGGYTRGFAFPMQQKTSWTNDHVPLPELFGIVLDESIETAQNLLDSPYLIEEWGLPEKQILLAGDGHWWITLDYRKGHIPKVSWIDVECEEDVIIAKSFDEFVNGLVSVDMYLL